MCCLAPALARLPCAGGVRQRIALAFARRVQAPGKLCCHQVKITLHPRLPAPESARGQLIGKARLIGQGGTQSNSDESAAFHAVAQPPHAGFLVTGRCRSGCPARRSDGFQQHKTRARIADAAICARKSARLVKRGDRYGPACRPESLVSPSNAGRRTSVRLAFGLRPARGHACEPQYGPNHSNSRSGNANGAPDRSPQGPPKVRRPPATTRSSDRIERGNSHPQRRVRDNHAQSFLRPGLRRARSPLRPPGSPCARETVAGGARRLLGWNVRFISSSKTGAGRPGTRRAAWTTGIRGARLWESLPRGQATPATAAKIRA